MCGVSVEGVCVDGSGGWGGGGGGDKSHEIQG